MTQGFPTFKVMGNSMNPSRKQKKMM